MSPLRRLLRLVPLLATGPLQGWTPLDTCGNAYTRWAPGAPETTWRLSTSHASDELGTAQVDAAFAAAFAEWGRPGCSSFDAAQLSDRSGDPMDEDIEDNLIGWYENAWPGSFGQTTLAITVPVWFTEECDIVAADMVFNGTNTDWIVGTPDPQFESDLQSVATHEVGHWIGFDHNGYEGSSLATFYSGALDERTLVCDDSEGVCDAYPASSTQCDNRNYCDCGVDCINGVCDGVVGDDDDDDDDDDTSPAPCGVTLGSFGEGEPNDEEPVALDGAGRDLRISGRVSCGNDGEFYTGDYDYLRWDPGCAAAARITLSWSGDADLDLFLWDAAGADAGSATTTGTAGPEVLEATLGEGTELLVACWEGATVDWTLTLDLQPWAATGDDDDASGDDDDDDDDGGIWSPFDEDGACNCATGSPAFGGLLLLALRRRRAGYR